MEPLPGYKPLRSVNGILIAYAILSALFIVVLFDYVKPDPSERVSYLTYFIYLIGIIGLYLFYRYYFRTEREKHDAGLTQQQARGLLQDIKGKGMEYHLHQFKDLGSKDEKLSINRMIDHIYTEAESKKFDSSIAILASSREEFAAQSMRLFGFQKAALQLGILGTFIGLAMAFKDLGGQVDKYALDHLLKSLKIPFSTSIAGLQVAFILWLHVNYLQKKHEKLFMVAEKCIDQVINLARNAIYKDSVTLELQIVSSRMDELSGRIEKGNELLQNQSTQITKGINRLRTANDEFNAFLQGITEKQQDFLGSVRSLYESLSPEAISTGLKNSFDHGAACISDLMGRHLNDTLGRYSEVEKSMASINGDFKELQVYIATQVREGNENTVKQKHEMLEAFNGLMNMQKQYLEQLAKVDMREHVKQVLQSSAKSVTTELKSNFDKLIPEVSSLAKEIAAYNERIAKKDAQKWYGALTAVFKKHKNAKIKEGHLV